MNLTPEKRNLIAKWLIKIATVCILLYLCLQNIAAISAALSRFLDLIMPLILGSAIAVILNVPMRFLEAHLWTKSDHPLLQRLRRPTAFLLSVLFIIGAFLGVILLVIPELVDAFSVIAQGIAELVEKLSSADQEKLMAHPLSKALMDIDWDGMLASAQEWLKAEGGQIVDTAFGTLASLIGGIFDFFIAFVFSVYILFGKEKLTRQASRLIRVWIPGKGGEWLIHAASITNVTFRKFISGQSLEALILGSLCMIGIHDPDREPHPGRRLRHLSAHPAADRRQPDLSQGDGQPGQHAWHVDHGGRYGRRRHRRADRHAAQRTDRIRRLYPAAGSDQEPGTAAVCPAGSGQ